MVSIKNRIPFCEIYFRRKFSFLELNYTCFLLIAILEFRIFDTWDFIYSKVNLRFFDKALIASFSISCNDIL